MPNMAMVIESRRRLIQVSIEAFALIPGVIQVSFSRDLIYKAMGQNKHMIIRDIVLAETIIVELFFLSEKLLKNFLWVLLNLFWWFGQNYNHKAYVKNESIELVALEMLMNYA